jgi:sugar-specific transcriptional regulator TrmB
MYEQRGLQLLMQMGLTKSQAELYLALLKSGEIDRKTLRKGKLAT